MYSAHNGRTFFLSEMSLTRYIHCQNNFTLLKRSFKWMGISRGILFISLYALFHYIPFCYDEVRIYNVLTLEGGASWARWCRNIVERTAQKEDTICLASFYASTLLYQHQPPDTVEPTYNDPRYTSRL